MNIVLDKFRKYVDLVRREALARLSPRFTDFDFSALSLTSLSSFYYLDRRSGVKLEELQRIWSLEKSFENRFVVPHFFRSDLIYPDDENWDEMEVLWSEARDFLEAIWPEMYQAFNILISRIAHLPRSVKSPESYSDPKEFGQICSQWTRFNRVGLMEILVHELAHHIVFVQSANQDFYQATNWRDEVFSGIRKEVRPLIGVYHGLAAESSILLLTRRLRAFSGLSSEEMDQCATIEKKYIPIFLTDFNEIQRRELLEKDLWLAQHFYEASEWVEELSA